MKVGIKCPIECDLTNGNFGICDPEGTQVAGGTLTGDRWPGTSGLYVAKSKKVRTEVVGCMLAAIK